MAVRFLGSANFESWVDGILTRNRVGKPTLQLFNFHARLDQFSGILSISPWMQLIVIADSSNPSVSGTVRESPESLVFEPSVSRLPVTLGIRELEVKVFGKRAELILIGIADVALSSDLGVASERVLPLQIVLLAAILCVLCLDTHGWGDVLQSEAVVIRAEEVHITKIQARHLGRQSARFLVQGSAGWLAGGKQNPRLLTVLGFVCFYALTVFQEPPSLQHYVKTLERAEGEYEKFKSSRIE